MSRIGLASAEQSLFGWTNLRGAPADQRHADYEPLRWGLMGGLPLLRLAVGRIAWRDRAIPVSQPAESGLSPGTAQLS